MERKCKELLRSGKTGKKTLKSGKNMKDISFNFLQKNPKISAT